MNILKEMILTCGFKAKLYSNIRSDHIQEQGRILPSKESIHTAGISLTSKTIPASSACLISNGVRQKPCYKALFFMYYSLKSKTIYNLKVQIIMLKSIV